MASWDAYITDHLMTELPNGGALTSSAILGQDGSVWAKSDDFPEITEEQSASIMSGFDDEAKLAEKGLYIGAQKFLVVQGIPEESIRGRLGEMGVCIKKTNTAMVVGIYGKGVQGGDCNVLVEGLGDYLKEMGM